MKAPAMLTTLIVCLAITPCGSAESAELSFARNGDSPQPQAGSRQLHGIELAQRSKSASGCATWDVPDGGQEGPAVAHRTWIQGCAYIPILRFSDDSSARDEPAIRERACRWDIQLLDDLASSKHKGLTEKVTRAAGEQLLADCPEFAAEIHPQVAALGRAVEAREWKDALQANTEKSFADFLSSFPGSRRKAEAEKKRAKAAAIEAARAEAQRAAIAKAERAETARAEAGRAALAKVENDEGLLNSERLRGPTKADMAREETDAWRRARKEDTAEAYESFLEEYDESARYRRAAEARLAAIERKEKAEAARSARQEAAEQARQAAKERAEERARQAALRAKYVFRHQGAWAKAVESLDPSAGNTNSGFTLHVQGGPLMVNPEGPSRADPNADNATVDGTAPQILSMRALDDSLIVEVVLPTKGEEIVIDEPTFRQITLDLRSSERLPCSGILFNGLLTVVYVPSHSSLHLDGSSGGVGVAGTVPIENGPFDQQPGVRFVTRQTAIVPLVFPVATRRLPSASELKLHFLGQVLRVNSAK